LKQAVCGQTLSRKSSAVSIQQVSENLSLSIRPLDRAAPSQPVTQPERVDEHRVGAQQYRLQIVIAKYAGIVDPPPSSALVFLDEDPNSIQNTWR
jgi:hypothetical protein